MTSRRNFLKQAGTVGIGAGVAAVAVTNTAAAAAHTTKGMHKMPRNVKLLSMRNADGVESLGVVTAEGVIDVRATASKLAIAAPLTLDELLQDGQADALDPHRTGVAVIHP